MSEKKMKLHGREYLKLIVDAKKKFYQRKTYSIFANFSPGQNYPNWKGSFIVLTP